MYAALLLPGGALGNRLGRRTAFLVGISGFAAGSLLCAVAPGLVVLLAGRCVQALGARWQHSCSARRGPRDSAYRR